MLGHLLSIALVFVACAVLAVAAAGETRPFTFTKDAKGLHIPDGELTIQVEPSL